MQGADHPVNLPGRMLAAWRATALELAKLPRGTNRKESTPEELIGKVLRQETGTIIELWESFTKERGQLSRGMLGSQRQTVAYLLGFHLVNAARTMLLLRRVSERTNLQAWLKSMGRTATAAKPAVTWYDLGCGTGAVAHSVSDFLASSGLPPSSLAFHLYDTSPSLLAAASSVLANAGTGSAVKTHRLSLETLDTSRFPVAAEDELHGISLGYVWNELERNLEARARLLRLMREQAAGPTLVLLLEPATQPFSRGAMDLRDQLVAFGYAPLYPCPSAKPCPMRPLTRDWCYSEGTWQQPKIMQNLDKSLGISRQHLSGTLFAFASPKLAQALKATPKDPVIVGRPERTGPQDLKAKRKVIYDLLLCEDGALSKAAPPPEVASLPRGTFFNPSDFK